MATKKSNGSDSIRFAQLSDPHLSTLNGVKWRELANKRVLGYLSWIKKRRSEHRIEILDALQRDLLSTKPDHIVVTGDLTHIGLRTEFLQARRWLEDLGIPEQVTVIPGNHDAYVRSPWRHSFRHWMPYMESDKPGIDGGGKKPAVFPSLRVRGQVAFIGLSSARPSAPFLAIGSVGPRQLAQFSELLEKTGRNELFRVVLVHHPPVPGTEKWRKRLTDAKHLCEVIANHGAELVLHGHSHRAKESFIATPGAKIPVFGIPSASMFTENTERVAEYYLYRVQRRVNDWRLTVSVRQYHIDREEFVAQHERKLDVPIRS